MYDDDARSSWQWMWSIVEAVFTQHMKTGSTMLSHLETSWLAIQKEELGVIIARQFYGHLFKIAPQLQPMFTKPFRMQLMMLVQALDLIVRCVRDTRVLSTELKGLAMGHIK